MHSHNEITKSWYCGNNYSSKKKKTNWGAFNVKQIDVDAIELILFWSKWRNFHLDYYLNVTNWKNILKFKLTNEKKEKEITLC